MSERLDKKCVWKELVETRGTTGQDMINRSNEGENIPCVSECDGSKEYAEKINCTNYVTRK